jgi:hypothetical protein
MMICSLGSCGFFEVSDNCYKLFELGFLRFYGFNRIDLPDF